jgi:hypothetical protein
VSQQQVCVQEVRELLRVECELCQELQHTTIGSNTLVSKRKRERNRSVRRVSIVDRDESRATIQRDNVAKRLDERE